MIRTTILLVICGLSLTVTALAQKKPVPKSAPEIRRELITGQTDRVAETKDFAFVIAVDKYGNSTLKIQSNEPADLITPGQLDDFFDGFRVLQNSPKRPASSKYLDPIVVVKPDADVELRTIITVISAARVSSKSRLKIYDGDNTYLVVPGKPASSNLIKPNPLTLVVRLDDLGNLTLNNEKFGGRSDMAPLTKRLAEVFRAREDNGVFREGTNEVEKAVFIRVPLSAKYRDLLNIAKALKNTGANPLGLLIDDLVVTDPPRRDLVPIK